MPIRALVVDDSAFMRRVITDILSRDPGIEVVGSARDGLQAVEQCRALKPDVITMDVEMPNMDGISALERIMKSNPVPVVMVSNLTVEGAAATLRSLELGAVDFITKPSGPVSLDLERVSDQIIEKAKVAAGVDVTAKRPKAPRKTVQLHRKRTVRHLERVVVIATSTGGPRALQYVIPVLPANLPAAVIVVQHMPRGFTTSLAKRLNAQSEIAVKEAEDSEPMTQGVVYLAPGGSHLALNSGGSLVLKDDPPIMGLKPCADVTFTSASRFFKDLVIGVVLTGMGHDGTVGLEAVKKAGGRTLAEDYSTCVVFGMPRSVIEKGLADKVAPINQIAEEIVRMVDE